MAADFFQWKEEYEFGIEVIDNQHKTLVEIINNVYITYINKANEETVTRILEELVDYTNCHFKTEEKYFIMFKYPLTVEHLTKHKEFVSKVAEYQEGVKKNPGLVNLKMMNYLRSWLLEHILGEDKKYIELFKNNGVI